jgi:flagellar M-ring protein FliF
VVELVSRPFATIEPQAEGAAPLLDLTREDYRRIGEMAVLSVLTLVVLFCGVRPTLRRIFAEAPPAPGAAGPVAALPAADAPPPVPGAPGTGPETGRQPALAAAAPGAAGSGHPADRSRPEIAALVETRPGDAARILRSWLNEPKRAG